MEEQIADMRAQLLHTEQGRQLLQEQLAEAQAERERDQRRVTSDCSGFGERVKQSAVMHGHSKRKSWC